MVQKVIRYFTRDIWRFHSKKLHGSRSFFIRAARIIILSFREFANDQCSLRASALTFYSLLSIVPVFAMAFGVAKGFGMDKLLQEKLIENMQGQQEILNRIIEFSENMLVNTKGGVIAGIGLVLLFWTVIQVLSNIEKSFNHIWGITKHRSLGQKFTDYLALMLIAPVFFIAASSATVFIVSQITLITEKITILGPIGPVILAALKLLPFAVFWGLLTFLYIFLPNGKIQFSSALLGGMIAGAIYNLVQWAYIHFQIGASNAGAVYGTFAALPLFLVWLQTSWLIVLYGAEIAFAHQNEDRFEFEQDCRSASYEFKRLLALRMTEVCVKRFVDGQPPISIEEMAEQVGAPIRLTRELMDLLVLSNVLTLAQTGDERAKHYQPARDVAEMTVQFVIDQIEKTGTQDIPIEETTELAALRESMRAFDRATSALPENFTLKDLRDLPVRKSRLSISPN